MFTHQHIYHTHMHLGWFLSLYALYQGCSWICPVMKWSLILICFRGESLYFLDLDIL